MMIKKCPQCKGSKKIIGIGMIARDCKECAGIGHVEDLIQPKKAMENAKVVKTRAKKSAPKGTPKIKVKKK